MERMGSKIAGLGIQRRKSFWVLLALEVLAVALAAAGLFGKNGVYQYDASTASTLGEYDAERGACVAGAEVPLQEDFVVFRNISVPAGTYEVRLLYETDVDGVNMCRVSDTTVGFRHLFTNGEVLYSGRQETGFMMWLLRDTEGMEIRAVHSGGNLTVRGLILARNNALQRIWLFAVLTVSMLVDGVWLWRAFDRQYGIGEVRKTVVFGLGLITVFASLPLMTDYILSSGDVGYHLMRIEGLKDGIVSGQFPVRIAPRWLQDYGYADAVFYGQTLLLPAALFRIVGFTVTTSYRMFILCVNLATAWLAYYCFRRIFGHPYIGLLCSMLYTLSLYRLYKLYMRGSLGEALGMMFLPLIAYGFWRVFTEDHKARAYRWCFLPLTVGMAGIVQTHMLTCELVGGFTVLLCVLLWKEVLCRETFLALAKALLGSLLLAAWFIVPFLDYMFTGDFIIHHVYERTIQERGLYPAHLFSIYPFAGGSVFPAEEGMVNAMPVGIGFGLLACLLLWCYLRMLGRKILRERGGLGERYLALGNIALGFAALAMFMSLSVFPWNGIQFLCRITATLVSSLQFPERLLMIAGICAVLVAGVLARAAFNQPQAGWKIGFCGVMAGLTVLTSMLMLDDLVHKTKFVKIYNAEGMGSGYIAGQEYLPYGTDASKLLWRLPAAGGTVEIEGSEQGPLTMEVICRNPGGENGSLDLPLLYYKGYRAWDRDTGERLPVYAGENQTVHVSVPPGYEGTVRAAFVSPWYWRLAEAVSLGSGIGLILLYRLERRRTGNRQRRDGNGKNREAAAKG